MSLHPLCIILSPLFSSLITSHLNTNHLSTQHSFQIVDTTADAESLLDTLPGNMQSLSDACGVVDALGPLARKDLMDEFVQLQLLPYEKIFSPGKPHFGLDHVDRRWAWIKRLVRTIDAKFKSICPMHWRVSQRLCLSFNERTKVHMHSMLSDFGDNSDVSALLKALQSTLR
jgi:vacuolar protein sorting-associated protein 53